MLLERLKDKNYYLVEKKFGITAYYNSGSLSVFMVTMIHFPFKHCSAFLLKLLLVEVSAIDLMKNVSIGFEFVTSALKTNVKTGPIKLQDKNRSSPSILSVLVITVAIFISHSLQSLYNISVVSFLLAFAEP